MNPDHNNKSEMTLNTLMQVGLGISTVVPVVFFAILGFLSALPQLDKATLVLIVVACTILVLLVTLVVGYFVQRRIRDRLLGLVSICRDYTAGDRLTRAMVTGDDEFAMLSASLNNLLDQGMSISSMPIDTSAGDAAALQAQIEKLLQEVSAVGDGDLRVQAEVTPDTLGVLADSFNYMIEELAKVVGRVQATAVQVTNATRRILDRSAELAQASETQVAQISQTSETVEALAIFIQNVARNAQLSAEVAMEALRNAASGQQAVRQTIDGMMTIRENVQETSKKIKRLGERSQEIGEIVRIIEDIADQTNLLALNAAIQSAMAGEHGRGFAVVADEIRLLAERSTDSTKRIATLVKSIQGDTYDAVVAMEDSTQEVVEGSKLADEAGRSLNSIYSAVERQAKMIERIARDAQEQTTVSEAVAVAMNRISEITRQTDAGTQEAAVSVSYLADLSEQLRSSVSTFQLPDRGSQLNDPFSPRFDLSDNNGKQMVAPGAPLGMNNEWGQLPGNFLPPNFSPAPERTNSGHLVASSPHGGEYAFSNPNEGLKQQPFSNQPNYSGRVPFSNPNEGLRQPQYSIQQDFNSGANQQQWFGSQQNVGDMSIPEGQQGFYGNGQPQQPLNLGGQGGQYQSYPYPNQGLMSPSAHPDLLPPPVVPSVVASVPPRPRGQVNSSSSDPHKGLEQ